MIAVNTRRLAFYLVLSYAVVAGGLSWWQVVDAQHLAARQDNPQVIAARRSAPRGSIFDARGLLLASSLVVDGTSQRTYRDPAFAQVIGYASLRYGTTGVERAWEVLEPVLDAPGQVVRYPRGGWGPAEADALIAPRKWHMSSEGD